MKRKTTKTRKSLGTVQNAGNIGSCESREGERGEGGSGVRKEGEATTRGGAAGSLCAQLVAFSCRVNRATVNSRIIERSALN